jgi:hypothetical protein
MTRTAQRLQIPPLEPCAPVCERDDVIDFDGQADGWRAQAAARLIAEDVITDPAPVLVVPALFRCPACAFHVAIAGRLMGGTAAGRHERGTAWLDAGTQGGSGHARRSIPARRHTP